MNCKITLELFILWTFEIVNISLQQIRFSFDEKRQFTLFCAKKYIKKTFRELAIANYFAAPRRFSSKCIPSSTDKMNDARLSLNGICVFWQRSNEKLSSKLYKIALSSVKANRDPEDGNVYV